MKGIYLYFIILLFSDVNVFSQLIFQKSFPYSVEGVTMDVENTIDGGYILLCRDKNSFSAITDHNYTIKVLKTNGIGAIEWTSNLSLNSSSLEDGIFGYSIKQTSDSGYIITGTRFLKDLVYDIEYNNLFIAKLNVNGNIVWNKCFASPGIVESAYGNDVIQTNDGNYVITGIKTVNYREKLFIMKLDSIGNLIWEKTLVPINLEYSSGYTVQETIDGNFFVAGTTIIAGITPNPFLVKVDVNGNTIWGKTYAGDAGRTYGIPTSDGGYIVETISGGNLLMKLNSIGNIVWCKRYPYGISSMSLAGDKGFVLCGDSGDFGTTGYSGFLLKTDSLGNISFLKTIDDTKFEFCSVKHTPDNGFVAIGDRYLPVPEILFVKADSMGFSGCNNVSGSPIAMPISLKDSTRYVINSSTGFNSTNTITINVIIDNAISETDLCSYQSLTKLPGEHQLTIIPNPNSGIFEIKNLYSKVSSVIIKVVDIYGKCVFSTTSEWQNQKLLLNLNIADGIYFLHISETVGSKEFIKKIVIIQ